MMNIFIISIKKIAIIVMIPCTFLLKFLYIYIWILTSILFVFVINIVLVKAQIGADEVKSFSPGINAIYGIEYFPFNVLGYPDTSARAEIPTINPKEILSLGIDGEIVLKFTRVEIIDKPGIDFIVYENAFNYYLGKKLLTYIEPAEVSVSKDGVNFVAFEYNKESLIGCAGITPTFGENFFKNILSSGGNGFDLSKISLDSIRYIKIKDVSSIIKDPTHPLFDATANGFDLDAIVALNYTSEFTNALESVKSEPVKLELSLNDKKLSEMWFEF